ncbi:GPI transamidase component [Coemansia sp. IMI 203386]|nr:GPI transamidase component [Coemansia sp. IMI 203386]
MPLPAKLRAVFQRRSDPKTIISVHSERLVVLVSILIVCLLGLPMWWTTTRVYRAELPTDQISRFTPKETLTIPLVFYINPTSGSPLSQDLLADIEKTATGLVDSQRQQYAPKEWRVRYQPVVRSGPAPDIAGHYTLSVHTDTLGAPASVEFAVGRTALVTIPEKRSKKATLATLISDIIVKEEGETRQLSHGRSDRVSASRALKYSPEYAVTFTLLNEDPVNGVTVDWDIEAAIEAYIRPFVEMLSPLTKLSITSQVLHDAGPPPIKPISSDNQTLLTPDMLTRFVNSPSWNLASTDPVSPMLNFILYIPALQSQPMHITRANKQLQTNAFLVSQWGGVAIANLPERTSPGSHIVLSRSQLQSYMGVFISQLRELIGIRKDIPLGTHRYSPNSIDKVSLHHAASTGISSWEFDALLRQWLISTRQNAITTLQSLTRLTESMQNMVVMDEIKTKVDGSLGELGFISHALYPDVNHLQACIHAARASSLAENAFFDPSMVSLLYFPDQHKYAIYLPFFLPVAMPLLTALKRVIKQYKKSKSTPENGSTATKSKNE